MLYIYIQYLHGYIMLYLFLLVDTWWNCIQDPLDPKGGFIPGGGEKSEARAERIERELGLVAGGLGGREAGARDGPGIPGQSSRKNRCEVQMEL